MQTLSDHTATYPETKMPLFLTGGLTLFTVIWLFKLRMDLRILRIDLRMSG